jgi:hypothetical protein
MTCNDGPQVYSRLVAGATNLVRLIGLVDEAATPPSYPIDAAVTATIVDEADASITGAVDLPMLLDGATSGAATEYRGPVPASVPLVAGQYVTVRVRAVVSFAEMTFVARVLVLAA